VPSAKGSPLQATPRASQGGRARVPPAGAATKEGTMGSERVTFKTADGVENGAIPADFADEARQAWQNIGAILPAT